MDREHMKKRNTVILRCVCIALILFSLALGCTFRKTGYCWGDQLFAALGLPTWSNGERMYSPASIGIILLLISCGVFSSSFQKHRKLISCGVFLGIWLLLVAVSKLLNLLL